jgi:hypothetical protein
MQNNNRAHVACAGAPHLRHAEQQPGTSHMMISTNGLLHPLNPPPPLVGTTHSAKLTWAANALLGTCRPLRCSCRRTPILKQLQTTHTGLQGATANGVAIPAVLCCDTFPKSADGALFALARAGIQPSSELALAGVAVGGWDLVCFAGLAAAVPAACK